MKKTKQIAFYLEEDLADALAIASEKAGKPQAELIRDILRQELLGEKTPLKVGELAEMYIRKGLSNQVIAEKIREERPGAKTSPKSVAWYRVQMKKADQG